MLKRETPDHQRKALYQLRVVTRIFALVVILLLVVGYFLPKSYHIERSIRIEATQIEVADFLAQASNLPEWLYVQKGRVELLDVALTEGLSLSINYESGDKGFIEIGELRSARYEFDVVPKEGQRAVANELHLKALVSGNETRVSWSINGELESGLLSPYLALFANDIAGANFEKSLSQLKVLLEK